MENAGKLLEVKYWKNGKSFLFFFLKAATSASLVKFFSCLSNLIQSRLHVMEKAFFLRFFKVSVDHLFDKLMLAWLQKKSGWSLEFWIKICTNSVFRIPTRNLVSGVVTSPISDSPFIVIGAARRRAASLRYRNRPEITVPICEQKSYPIWSVSCRCKSYLV